MHVTNNYFHPTYILVQPPHEKINIYICLPIIWGNPLRTLIVDQSWKLNGCIKIPYLPVPSQIRNRIAQSLRHCTFGCDSGKCPHTGMSYGSVHTTICSHELAARGGGGYVFSSTSSGTWNWNYLNWNSWMQLTWNIGINEFIYQIGTTGIYEFWNFEFWKLTKFGGLAYA